MEQMRPESRLPEDPGYWNAFADRVAAASAAELSRHRRGGAAWWTVLGDLSPVLAGGAVAAALAGWLLLPGARPAPDAGPAALVAVTLSPGDSLARTLLDEGAAPFIGTLLVLPSPEED